jgi:hypothetical protein
MKRLKRLLLGSVGVALLLAGTAVPASAHAQLESTSPAQSSVLPWIHRPTTWQGSESGDRHSEGSTGFGRTSSAGVGAWETKNL